VPWPRGEHGRAGKDAVLGVGTDERRRVLNPISVPQRAEQQQHPRDPGRNPARLFLHS
jgi:hypothetical protein